MEKKIPVFLDWEARSRVDITQVGLYRYAEDPSTEILCLAYKIGLSGKIKIWFPGLPLPEFVYKKNILLIAHYAEVEWLIWNLIFHVKHGAPKKSLSSFYCTATQAAYNGLPRKLEHAGAFLNLRVQKDLVGRDAMLKLSKPKRNGEFITKEERPDLYKKLHEYCIIDVDVSYLIYTTTTKLPQQVQEDWRLTARMNNRGINIDVAAIRNIIKRYNFHAKRLIALIETKYNGLNLRSHPQIVAFAKSQNYKKIKSFNAFNRSEILKDKKASLALKEVIKAKDIVSKTSVSKFKKMLTVLTISGRIKGFLVFYGAAKTGRHTSFILQLQNLPKATIKPEIVNKIYGLLSINKYSIKKDRILKTAKSLIRGALIPSKGNIFHVGDYPAIEPRVLFWLAECETGLKLYREGGKIYEFIASKIFNIPIENIIKESLERFIGKESTLACGYGMGLKRFRERLAQFKIYIPDRLIEKIINIYRTTYKEVPALWKDLEYCAKQAVKHKGKVFINKTKKVKFYMDSKYDRLCIKLPSERELFYWYPEIKPKKVKAVINGEIKEWVSQELSYRVHKNGKTSSYRESLYGGLIAENIVQSISGDILRNGLHNLERNKFHPVLTIHDENVSDDKKRRPKLFAKCMTDLPPWAVGIPIGEVEVEILERYEKYQKPLKFAS